MNEPKPEWKTGGGTVDGRTVFQPTIEGLQRLKDSLEGDAEKAEADLQRAKADLLRLIHGGSG